MTQKKENVRRNAVHKFLPKNVYHVKMSNPWVGGIPDDYYSGPGGDMWVEWKWVEKLPKRTKLKPKLTPLQRAWLDDRADEGRHTRVIVGYPKGNLILNREDWDGFDFQPTHTNETTADWIATQCL